MYSVASIIPEPKHLTASELRQTGWTKLLYKLFALVTGKMEAQAGSEACHTIETLGDNLKDGQTRNNLSKLRCCSVWRFKD